MSESIGSFVTEDTANGGSGKPVAVPSLKPIGGNQGPIGEPEIIAGYDAIEPETIRLDSILSGAPDGESPRKRGRKPGSRNPPKPAEEKQVPRSLIDLTDLLLSIHMTGAALLNIQELALEPSEAKSLADAIKEVAKHYPVAFDPKKVAIANLLIVAGGIYGTRIMAYRATHKKDSKPAPGPGKLVNMPKTNGAPAPPTEVNLRGHSPSELWFQPPIDNASF